MGKWFKTIRNSNGDFDTYEWSLDKEIGVFLGKNIGWIIFIVLIPQIATIALMMAYIISHEEHKRMWNSIVALIINLYLVIDCMFGLALWNLFDGDVYILNVYFTFGLHAIPVSLILFIFHEKMYGFIWSIGGFISYIAMIIGIMYLTNKYIINQIDDVAKILVK
jgi:hypothetical protein